MHRFNAKNPFYVTFFISFFIALLDSISLNAQEYIYQHFGVDDGLPSSEVYDIYQDKEGYIWFATDKGLSRYNGYEFENYDTSDGLTGNVVLRFYPQENGQVWCYTFHNKSIFYFDEIFTGFKQYKYNNILDENLTKRAIIKSLYLDASNNLHIGGVDINGELIIKNDGILINNYTSESSFQDSTYLSKMVLMNYENSLTSPFHFYTKDTSEYDSNILYIYRLTKSMTVSRFDDYETAVFMSDYLVEINNQNQRITTITDEHTPVGLKVIDSTHFFVGYLYGGGKIIDKNGTIKYEFLKNKSVTNFLIDHEGGYWFTTRASGLYYIANPTTLICNTIKTRSNDINSLAKTNTQELLIAYKNGTIAKFSNYKSPTIIDIPDGSTYGFVEYDSLNDNIYFYNRAGLCKGSRKNNLKTQYFLKISEQFDGSFFAASPIGFCSITENQEIREFPSPFRILDICIWNRDTLIASPTGVFKYNNGKFDSLTDQSELFNYRCEDIDVNSSQNRLFVATQGVGIIVNDGTQLHNITETDGLNSNVVNEIYVENDTTIWACTNRGINRIIFAGNETLITGINKKEGLLSNEVEDIEIINDTVWVGTKQGLCSIPISQLTTKKVDDSYFKIKEVFINNVSIDVSTNSILNHKENAIDIEVEGISYASKNNLFYKFRLNKDLNWSTTKDRIIHLSSLHPGEYHFEAKMCLDEVNCGDKTISYTFTIQAPFWKRGWFMILCISLFGMLIYTFFRIRVFTYNKDITREFIRLLVKRLKRKEKYFSFREDGKDIRVKSNKIIYIKSAGNYIDVHTEHKTHTIRMNIGKFLDNVPDKLEYVRLHRSYIVRIDKITSKSRNEVELTSGMRIPVSLNHYKKLKEVVF